MYFDSRSTLDTWKHYQLHEINVDDVVELTTTTTINCTDYNCSYNGECIITGFLSSMDSNNGTRTSGSDDDDTFSSSWYCQCDYGWFGKYCEQLNLGIAINGSGLSHMLHETTETNPNPISTWGGSVIYDIKTKLYHMFYSEIKNNCEYYI